MTKPARETAKKKEVQPKATFWRIRAVFGLWQLSSDTAIGPLTGEATVDSARRSIFAKLCGGLRLRQG